MLQSKSPTIPPYVVMVTVLLGTLTVSLNNSALNPAIPEFMTIFGTGPLLASWIVAGFMMAMGLTMPLTGYLSARYGKRRIYLIGLALFICGSLAGALAGDIYGVLAARVLQGVAGGLIIPLSLPLIFAAYGKEKRGRITGIWGTAVMLAPAIGPFIGGVVLELSSWPVLFVMNIPVGLAAFGIAATALPKTGDGLQNNLPFDSTGFVLATLAIGTTMLWLNLAPQGILPDAMLWLLPVIAALSFGTFILVELRGQNPLLSPALFAHSTYRTCIIIVTVQSVGMFVTVVLVPLLMHTILGLNAIWTGSALVCTAIFASISVNLGGRWLDWQGPRPTILSGLIITCFATLALGFCDGQTSLPALFGLMALRGVGLGLSYIPATTAGLNGIPENLLTQATAMNNISRRVVSSAGIVAASAYLEWHRQGTPTNPAQTLEAISQVFWVTGGMIACLLPVASRLPSKAFRQIATGGAA